MTSWRKQDAVRAVACSMERIYDVSVREWAIQFDSLIAVVCILFMLALKVLGSHLYD